MSAVVSSKTINRLTRLTKGAQAFKQEFTALSSSKHAQTLGPDVSLSATTTNFADFVVDPLYKSLPIRDQLHEISGKALKDKTHVWHTPHYETLLKSVVPLRQAFRDERK